MLLGNTFKSIKELLVAEILKIVLIILLIKDRIKKKFRMIKPYDFVKLCQAYEEHLYG